MDWGIREVAGALLALGFGLVLATFLLPQIFAFELCDLISGLVSIIKQATFGVFPLPCPAAGG